MALPTITINSSTGSDTAASGSGGTAVTAGGNNAAALSSNTSVDLSADAPDLSGVATDGSMALWVDASSGRQWSKITAVDNGTKIVTVETAYGVTESGRNWGIGGKRASIATSLQLFRDVLAGWIVDIENAGSSYTITTAIICNVAAATTALPIKIRSSSGTRPTITSATNSVVIFNISSATNWIFENLKVTHTAATRGEGFTPVSANCTDIIIRNCVIDGCINAIESDNLVNFQCTRLSISSCEILNSTGDGVQVTSATCVTDCYIHDNTGDGLQVNAVLSSTTMIVTNSVFEGNGAYGFRFASANSPLLISHCTFTANTSSGVLTGSSNNFMPTIRNCIFYSNGTYGLEMGSQGLSNYDTDYNAYGANGTAARLTFTAGSNDITLTGNPFNSATDFGLNSTAGAGLAVRKTASAVTNATANLASDVGAIASGGGAVTGGLLRNPDLTGGMR